MYVFILVCQRIFVGLYWDATNKETNNQAGVDRTKSFYWACEHSSNIGTCKWYRQHEVCCGRLNECHLSAPLSNTDWSEVICPLIVFHFSYTGTCSNVLEFTFTTHHVCTSIYPTQAHTKECAWVGYKIITITVQIFAKTTCPANGNCYCF